MSASESPFRIVDRARRMGESGGDWSLACFVLRDTPEVLGDEILRSLAFECARSGYVVRNDFEGLAEHYLRECNRIAIATARAEGETAGYARGRREAFSEAAEIADTYIGRHDTALSRVLRAKAGEV